MKTNSVPSLACKGNGMTLGLTDSSVLAGLTMLGSSLLGRTGTYGKPVGTSASGTGFPLDAIGITTDSSKSGIITDTGSMSSITSKAIIKY